MFIVINLFLCLFINDFFLWYNLILMYVYKNDEGIKIIELRIKLIYLIGEIVYEMNKMIVC